MSKEPTVSVLMSAYNAEQHLTQAVESILAQTFTDFEFIIIDDGSTDGSMAILEAYAAQDKRIRLTSRDNKGVPRTRNELLNQAQGEFVAIMDADDVALPERFARQVEFLQREPNVVWVGGAFALIDEKGRLLLSRFEQAEKNDQIQQLLLAGGTSFLHPTAMIRRASIIEIGGYNETMVTASDLDLWLRLSEIGELANLRDTVLKYRVHADGISGRKRSLQREEGGKAFARAWQRRGIIGKQVDAVDRWHPEPNRSSRHDLMLKYGWWAFNSRQRQTALIYGTKAIAALPLAVNGWKLLACAAIKPLPDENSK